MIFPLSLIWYICLVQLYFTTPSTLYNILIVKRLITNLIEITLIEDATVKAFVWELYWCRYHGLGRTFRHRADHTDASALMCEK